MTFQPFNLFKQANLRLLIDENFDSRKNENYCLKAWNNTQKVTCRSIYELIDIDVKSEFKVLVY